MLLKSIISVIAFFLIDYLTKNMLISCLTITIVNLLILLFYDFKIIKNIKITKNKYNKKANLRIIKSGLFTFLLNFISIYLMNISRYAIDDLLPNNMQTIYGIIIMPASFMSLIAQYVIQPVIIKISEFIKENNYESIKRIVTKLMAIVSILGILIFIIAYALEIPILEYIYGIELDKYFTSAMIIIIGSVFYGINTMISLILIAMRKTLSQVITYGILSIISTIICYILVEYFRNYRSKY